MTQDQLNAAVAEKTGESLNTIAHRGFSLVHPINVFNSEPDDHEPLIIDSDELYSPC